MSMTGFGRGERHGEEISVTVEVRTVNHRFLDLHTRCPGRFLSWEPRIRGIVRESVRRGKVDMHVNVREWGKLGAGLRVNDELLRSFLGETRRIREEHGIGGEVTLRDLLSVPDLFQAAPVGGDPAELLWPVAEGAVRDALGMLGRARAEEGDRMKQVLQESAARLEGLAREIRSLTAENKEQAAARFRERIAALSSLAETAARRAYVRPELHDGIEIEIRDGRLRKWRYRREDDIRSPGLDQLHHLFEDHRTKSLVDDGSRQIEDHHGDVAGGRITTDQFDRVQDGITALERNHHHGSPDMDDGTAGLDLVRAGFGIAESVQMGLDEGAKDREGQGIEHSECHGVTRLAPGRGFVCREAAAVAPTRAATRFEREHVGV